MLLLYAEYIMNLKVLAKPFPTTFGNTSGFLFDGLIFSPVDKPLRLYWKFWVGLVKSIFRITLEFLLAKIWFLFTITGKEVELWPDCLPLTSKGALFNI